MVFLTCQVNRPPPDLVGERPEDDVPDQEPGEKQRPGEADLIGLLLDEKPLEHRGKAHLLSQRRRLGEGDDELKLPHLRHYGVNVLREGDALEELLLAGRDPVLRLHAVLRRGSNQNDQHGLTGHVHLEAHGSAQYLRD